MRKLSCFVWIVLSITIIHSCSLKHPEDVIEINKIDRDIIIDGNLNETDWHLSKHDFISKNGTIEQDIPEFQILRNDSLLFFAAKYSIPDSSYIENNNINRIFFRISLNPNDTSDFKYRVDFIQLFNANKMHYVDKNPCKHYYPMMDSFKHSFEITNNNWIIEFSLTINDLIMKGFDLVKLDLAFYKQYNENEFMRAYYPEDGEYVIIRIRD